MEQFEFDESLFADWDLEQGGECMVAHSERLSDNFICSPAPQSVDIQMKEAIPRRLTHELPTGISLVKSRKVKPTKSIRDVKTPRKRLACANSPTELDVVPAELKLYAFPSFDKSDAMLYLPSTIARLTNSGARDECNRLLKNHCAKDCQVVLGKYNTVSISLMKYTGLLDIVDSIFPDMFSCMHSTKVEDNRISADMYFKYTNSPDIHRNAHTIKGISSDPFYKSAFLGNRKELLYRDTQLVHQSEEIRNRIAALIELDEEMEIYGKESLTFTIDPHSKKILTYRSAITIVSVRHASVVYKFTS